MKLGPVKRVKLYEQVVSSFREKFEAGELKPGDRIPAERDLVDQLGVSRAVLREALRVMEVKGVLETVPGEGRVFAGSSMIDLERINDQVRQSAVLEVLDARQGIECRTAELAAARATPMDIRLMRSFVPEANTVIDEPGANFEMNRNFHLAVAAAAQNAVLHEVLRMLLNLRGDIHRTDLLNAAAYQQTFREHLSLVDAIEQGNADEARELMRLHLEHTKDAIRRTAPVP